MALCAFPCQATSAQPVVLSVQVTSETPNLSSNGRELGSAATAVAQALAHNPQIEIAKSQERSADAEGIRALGRFLPNVQANVSYTDDSWRSTSLDTLNDRDGATLGFTVSQPIFQGLESFNQFREARARITQAELSLLDTRHQIGLQAASAHAGVILAREIASHRKENFKLVSRQFEVAEKRRAAGAQSRTGVEQAKMRRAQAQVDLNQAREALAQSEAAYIRVVGAPAPEKLAKDDRGNIFGLETYDSALANALTAKPTLNAARAGAKAAQHAKNAAKSGFSPRLSLEGSYFRRYGDNIAPTDEEEYQLVARVRMPIFSQGQNIANLKSATASATQSGAQLRATRLLIEETILRGWRQLEGARLRKIAASQAIEAATLSVKGLEIEYEAGRRTVIDVLDGQRDLVTARISLTQAEHDLRVTQYELAAATGRLLALIGEG